MSHQKIAIIIFGYLIGGLCVFGRLMMSGWLFLFGITSIIIFGIMHLAFMLDINKYYDDLLKSDKIIAWTGVLTFPFIFLFQFDFGDQPGNFYVYEIILGQSDSKFQELAWLLAIVAALIYTFTFICWKIYLRTYRNIN
jgi:hypothetical protein